MSAKESAAAFDTDHNLLFGVLALQADLLDASRFAEACAAWAARKGTPLADLLVERGWLTPQDRADVERLLARKLSKHDGDARAGLAAAAGPAVLETLWALQDADVQHSLGALPGAAGPTLPETTAYHPQARGRYTLTQLHARGGIGQVWRARDADLGRDVALKEPRPDQAGSPALLARLLEEARITGQLEHPGIVPVYELARHPRDGRPFYTMRFVKGRTLAEAARDFHARRRAGQAEALELRELLGAFVAVCNAVAYAHSRGVLHRDLKGQNVVLGDFGEVVVLDWGLAKLIGEGGGTVLGEPVAVEPGSREDTVQGQVLGTPGFMAPEQAAGDAGRVDRRTDVYGLGALLYQVLTGEPPFSGADTRDVLRKVVHEAPAAPRALWPGVSAALEAVCLKALAKGPEQRYATARQVADEVRHWLADEPVAAYPDPVVTRLGRWGRRHRPLVTAAAALLVALVAALAAGTVLLGEANARTEQARREAEGQRDLARENFDKARQAVDDYFVQVSENKLLKSPLPGLQPLRKELLESALKYYRGFAEQHQDDPAVQAALAQAYHRVGRITEEVGTKAEALTALQRARDLYEMLTRARPDDAPLANELANCYSEIGILQSQTGQPADGLRSLEQAVALGGTLTRNHPDVATYRYDLATIYRRLAHVQKLHGKADDAVASLHHSLALLDDLARSDPRSVPYQVARAAAWNNLGLVHTFGGQTRAALEADRRALEIWERLDRENPGEPEVQNGLAATSGNLGWMLSLRDHPTEALAAYERALAVREKMARENPKVGQYQTEWARILTSLGSLYQTLDQPARARQSFEQAVAIRVKLLGDNPATDLQMDLAWTYTQFGNLVIATGQADEASRLYRQALDLATKLMATDSADPTLLYIVSATHGGLGRVYSKEGRPAEALQSLREALAALDRVSSTDLNVLYDRACWLALCSSVVGKGKASLTPAEQAERRKYGDQAMDALRQAVKAGQFSVHDLRTDPDLDALRQRPDFKELVEGVVKQGSTAPDDHK
jgi:serine/threonine-protein kinase